MRMKQEAESERARAELKKQWERVLKKCQRGTSYANTKSLACFTDAKLS